jgi:cation diffusion facilitator family transporter
MKNRHAKIRNVAITGIISNLLLLVFKLFVGFSANSHAMIADGFNSAGDVFASIMTFTGNKIASKPEDDDHPYGHGKAEYVFSMIISFSLVLVAYSILKNSYNSIINKEELEYSLLLILTAIFTIILKSILYFYTQHIGKKHASLLVIANAEDHRNDVFVTLLTLSSVIFSKIGIYWLDGVAGIIISLWIAYTGIKIFLSAYDVLMDKNIPESMKKNIEKIIMTIEGVDHLDDITAKPTGINFILIIKVSVAGSMSVKESHNIAAEIRDRLKHINIVDDAIVHINPV